MLSLTPTVFVVDPDASLRHSLEIAIREAGWNPEIASSARPFLSGPPLQAPSCLLLDVGALLPDLSCFHLLRRLATEREEIPVVAMSAEPTIALTVRAIQAGAFEFLISATVKPSYYRKRSCSSSAIGTPR